jgi:type IV pilus assembly protein PilN
MATINLRPWREERAGARKKAFSMNILGAAILAALIVFAIGYYFDLMKDRQNDRNSFLKAETVKLDKDLVAIRKLKEERARLLERMSAIQNLQASRPLIVRNFDELVRVLPEGIHYSSLTRRGSRVAVSGMAADKLDVSALMRNLGSSIWFGEPNLSSVDKSGASMNSFKLSVSISGAKEIENAKKKGKGDNL